MQALSWFIGLPAILVGLLAIVVGMLVAKARKREVEQRKLAEKKRERVGLDDYLERHSPQRLLSLDHFDDSDCCDLGGDPGTDAK